jgi:hypothetical protein
MATIDKRIALAVFCLYITSTVLGRNPPTVRWGHQLVTPTEDVVRAAFAGSNDSIYFYVTENQKDTAGHDIFKKSTILKYNQKGNKIWTKQLDGYVVEDFTGDNQNYIYVFGYILDTFGKKTNGGHDAFIAKYDQSGTQLWVWPLGTSEHDVCTGLDFDADENMYISGYTYGDFAKPNQGGADMFIAVYDKNRALLWRDQIGTATDDRVMDIRVGDNNDVYICGNTSGALARQNNGLGDFVVARYERTGKSLWLYQYGTNAMDTIMCMERGELGHLYLGCRTNGNVGSRNPQRRDWDSCLVSINETGKMLWVRQFGTLYWDGTWDMARFQDGSGDILISGCQYPAGTCQAYCRRYSPEGKLIWVKEFSKKNSRGGTCGRVCAIDSANNCYHGGITHADQFGVNNGTQNVYIVRFDEAEKEQGNP